MIGAWEEYQSLDYATEDGGHLAPPYMRASSGITACLGPQEVQHVLYPTHSGFASSTEAPSTLEARHPTSEGHFIRVAVQEASSKVP